MTQMFELFVWQGINVIQIIVKQVISYKFLNINFMSQFIDVANIEMLNKYANTKQVVILSSPLVLWIHNDVTIGGYINRKGLITYSN